MFQRGPNGSRQETKREVAVRATVPPPVCGGQAPGDIVVNTEAPPGEDTQRENTAGTRNSISGRTFQNKRLSEAHVMGVGNTTLRENRSGNK